MEAITGRHDFRAWYMNADTPVPVYCPQSQTYTTSGSYATCCASSSCQMVTECRDNTLYSDGGTGRYCGTRNGDTCATVSVFYTSPSGLPIISHIHCHLQGRSNTMYRNLVAATDQSSTPNRLTYFRRKLTESTRSSNKNIGTAHHIAARNSGANGVHDVGSS
ncbi:hypothetical protein C8034_v011166 [Colletotrichum sidae]|uniref:Uncharacterized protein n=1 Tax=Colletotrichum sidae TaxID=1347389 RepID=A0A4R8TIW7_9PEZI|nr:hypothetical protein C8034_v011166 [Colletotrichum sidae]